MTFKLAACHMGRHRIVSLGSMLAVRPGGLASDSRPSRVAHMEATQDRLDADPPGAQTVRILWHHFCHRCDLHDHPRSARAHYTDFLVDLFRDHYSEEVIDAAKLLAPQLMPDVLQTWRGNSPHLPRPVEVSSPRPPPATLVPVGHRILLRRLWISFQAQHPWPFSRRAQYTTFLLELRRRGQEVLILTAAKQMSATLMSEPAQRATSLAFRRPGPPRERHAPPPHAPGGSALATVWEWDDHWLSTWVQWADRFLDCTRRRARLHLWWYYRQELRSLRLPAMASRVV